MELKITMFRKQISILNVFNLRAYIFILTNRIKENPKGDEQSRKYEFHFL